MRSRAALVALLLAGCSSGAGTTAMSSPTPTQPTTAVPTAPPVPTTRPAATHRPAVRRTAPATRSPSPAPKPKPRTWALTISGFAFDPATPSIRVGDSIRVTNQDPDPHTFTAKNHSFDSGDLAQGQSRTLRFTVAGVFDVVCSNHSSMTGQVLVSP